MVVDGHRLAAVEAAVFLLVLFVVCAGKAELYTLCENCLS